jgi:hypothetical protein
MPKCYEMPTLDDAKRMLSAAEAKAASLGLLYNIAVVDTGAICWRSCARKGAYRQQSIFLSTRR